MSLPATGGWRRLAGWRPTSGGQLAHVAVALGVSIGAAVLALGISLGIIAATGGPPGAAASALWDGAFGSRAQVAGTLAKMIPLTLVALGWIVAFSANRINIGFEGQILAGGVLATVAALKMGAPPAPIHLGLAVFAGIVGGSLYAGIAAWLWARRSVNEIISTLLLNLVAIQLVSWLVHGPLQEPTHAYPRSARIPSSARWPRLVPDTALSWDLVLAAAMVFVVWFVIRRTPFGFRLRLTGANQEAARHAGIATVRVTVMALLISGALAGLAGSSLILAGESGSMAENFSAGYGFAGIVVALVARNSPVGAIPAALLFAALIQGGGLMEARVGISSALVGITQGLVILLVAGVTFLFVRLAAVRVDAGERKDRVTPLPTVAGVKR